MPLTNFLVLSYFCIFLRIVLWCVRFQFVRIIFKILLIIFVLQSTWAVAAQYCQHEEGPKIDHIGHHTHNHSSQKNDANNIGDHKSINTSKSDIDTDCPYCHLGSIKSIITSLPILDAAIEPLVMVDIYYSYPEIIPRKPERPNWNSAA